MDSKAHSQPGGETEGAVDSTSLPRSEPGNDDTPAPFPEHLANLEVDATADPDLAGDPVVEDLNTDPDPAGDSVDDDPGTGGDSIVGEEPDNKGEDLDVVGCPTSIPGQGNLTRDLALQQKEARMTRRMRPRTALQEPDVCSLAQGRTFSADEEELKTYHNCFNH